MDRLQPAMTPTPAKTATTAALATLLVLLLNPAQLAAEPANTDWLEVTAGPDQTATPQLPASTITPRPETFYRGDRVTFDLVLSNATESAMRLDVEATLGLAAFFVDAD
ncbi:MAG: hypothetical protein AAFY88_16780, partial [Acidobacteriota bacterium]